jgi:ribosome-associated toxin RatA of RatAB toxin-antitoxin module
VPRVRQIERQALVPYSPAQMYALVDDIARYPEFLPWCKGARELSRSPAEAVATIHVHKGALTTHFTTRNRLEPPQAIHMELVQGPFKTFQGEWRFTAIGDKGSRVEVLLRFAFANPLNAWVLEPIFEHTSGSILDAFVRRARQLYG